jgi:D-beta-D-heptose 7-phosphate kinase/D-beta-D-heptose 1-phosphate adenosyltransferase
LLVVGDVMLDRYIWGDAERISQEAPVVLLRAERKDERLGGASSVATLLRALGARVSLLGVTGADADGLRVRHLLTDLGIDAEGVLDDPARPTTVKERYIGRAQARHPQQLMRVDYESRQAIPRFVESDLQRVVRQQIAQCDLVLISDYDKGVCTPSLLAQVIALAHANGKKVLADPVRGGDYRKYHGCSALTPNRLEAGLATGRTIRTTDDALAAADELRQQLDLEAAIVTLDKDGMALSHADGRRHTLPTRVRQVYDITGAGDMVMAMLGVALAAGADYEPAIRLANIAGGLEVEKVGVVPVTRAEIVADLQPMLPAPVRPKLVDGVALLEELADRRQQGAKIAFTNGCFDVLHAGHVQYLTEARAQADVLIVAVNTDSSIRHLKGIGRPVNPLSARAEVLAGLQAVDYVVAFDENTPQRLIELVRPDVLVKGADYRREQVVGGDFVESYGGRVHLAELRPGVSTTQLLQRVRAA